MRVQTGARHPGVCDPERRPARGLRHADARSGQRVSDRVHGRLLRPANFDRDRVSCDRDALRLPLRPVSAALFVHPAGLFVQDRAQQRRNRRLRPLVRELQLEADRDRRIVRHDRRQPRSALRPRDSGRRRVRVLVRLQGHRAGSLPVPGGRVRLLLHLDRSELRCDRREVHRGPERGRGDRAVQLGHLRRERSLCDHDARSDVFRRCARAGASGLRGRRLRVRGPRREELVQLLGRLLAPRRELHGNRALGPDVRVVAGQAARRTPIDLRHHVDRL